MRRSLGVLVLALATACGGDDGLSPPADIAGQWAYTMDLANATLQATCSSSGDVTLALDGNTATGTATYDLTCTSPVLDFQQAGVGPISHGTVDGARVKFTDDNGCTYTGTVSGTPPDVISGTVRCDVATSVGQVQVSGTWTAVPVVP